MNNDQIKIQKALIKYKTRKLKSKKYNIKLDIIYWLNYN